MTTWFTSDLHLGHRMVALMRDFETADGQGDAEEHDAVLMDRWAANVKPEDLVWVLGDIAMSRWGYALDCIAKLPGRKRALWGNHDPAHPRNRKAPKAAREAAEVFEYQSNVARTSVLGIRVWMSHFPHLGEGADRVDPPRYPEWRLPPEMGPLLHGHTHMAEQRLHGNQVHIGVDAWDLTPVSDEEIHELLKEI